MKMKKVVKVTPNNIVNTTDVSLTKYYGILCCDSKGFISRTSYKHGNFIVYRETELTNGNYYIINYKTLKDAIEAIIDYHNSEVFEFNTAKELFAWLAKE